jgi:hypothetical protein
VVKVLPSTPVSKRQGPGGSSNSLRAPPTGTRAFRDVGSNDIGSELQTYQTPRHQVEPVIDHGCAVCDRTLH